MNNIRPLRRQTPFNFPAPRAEQWPEGIALLTGLALTAWLPTILWCAALNHNLPLDIIAVTQVIGGIVGLGLYVHPPANPPRCVPKSIVSQVPNDRDYPKLPKAA
jgi:hypothetical protein